MAGSVTYEKNEIRVGNDLVEEHIWSWTADASDGTVPDTDSDSVITGFILHGLTDPGATAPTANYDITLEQADGMDVFGGELLDRSDTLTQQEVPLVGSAYTERFVNSVLTMTLSNNSVNSATGALKVYTRK